MSKNQSPARIYFEIEDEVTVFGVVNASSEPLEYSEEWLDEQLDEHGYSGLNVLKTAHEKIAELIASNKPGRVMLGYKIDALLEVELSADLLAAKLCITAPQGGDQASSRELVEVLNSKSISLNLVDKKRIVDLVQKSQIIEPGETVEAVVAMGRAVRHGKDSQFECLLENVTDRRPTERDDGSLDYYDKGEIPCVAAGCELMERLPPTPARNGRSVTGKDIKAKAGKKLPFSKCKGAQVSSTDPDRLVSIVKGQPVITSRGVIIENIYTVKSVDVHTGHIDYDGSLVVKGDVASGMKINVSGDVQVFGMVENACIDAGGNIDIKLGAVGRAESSKDEERMRINCKGNLSAGYMENVVVKVQGDVFIKSRLSNCEVNAGYQVVVGNPQQDKSGIVGGSTTAGSIIRAEVLGSTAGTLTSIAIACSQDVLQHFEVLKKEITEHEELLGRMLGLAVSLAKKQSAEAKQLQANVKKDTKEIKAKVNALISEKYDIEAALEKTRKGKIIVQKEVHPGVLISIMNKEQEIKSKYSKGVFVLVDDAMAFNSVMS